MTSPRASVVSRLPEHGAIVLITGTGFDTRGSGQFPVRSRRIHTHGVQQLAARADVMVFETPPLTEDVAIAGPVTVKLFVSSNCIDTDFTAKLIDVYPPNEDYPRGYAMNLCDGILRCRYRDSWEKPEMMTPGTVYEITIEPFATCNLFKAGHRIRIDISSSNFPRYDLNWNTGEPQGRARTRRIATNTVYVDGARASHVVLPLLPLAAVQPLPVGAGL